MELCSPLPKANHECKKEKQREKSNMKKFKRTETIGHISSTYWSPFSAYYMSFRSSRSQESNSLNGMWIGAEMKKLWLFKDNRTKLSENYVAAKWVAKISRPKAHFAAAKWAEKSLAKISQGVSQLWNHLQAHVCHFASWNSIFAAANQGAKSSPSCEPSCKIISKLQNHLQVAKSQIQLAKWRLSVCENFTRHAPTCEIHLCNLRYLLLTKLDFFSRYFV